ncbi:MAG: DMT family transporter [Cyanobacteria bacterium Co-bin13]|nr:DMT family transporter [Cyanobacteria bacterium Co-bin13]
MSIGFLSLVAVLGGAAIVLQSQFMGVMDKQLGTLESVFITYAGGGALVALLMLLVRGGNLRAWQTLPWYVYTSGALGLLIVSVISYIVPRLGLATAFTLMVATQFTLGAMVDQFGFLGAEIHPITPLKLVGLGLLFSGIVLIIR